MNVTQVHVAETAEHLSEAQRTRQAKLAELRTASEQLVGITFLQTLLKTSRNSSLKGEYGHGGRGEEMFTAQLDAVFAESMAGSSRFALVDEIYDRMAKRYLPDAASAGNEPDRPAAVNLLG